MFDSSDTLLDLTEYRHIAGYILALILLRQSRHIGLLGVKLRSRRDADWLAARLHNQGYAVEAIEPQGEQALLTIRKTV